MTAAWKYNLPAEKNDPEAGYYNVGSRVRVFPVGREPVAGTVSARQHQDGDGRSRWAYTVDGDDGRTYAPSSARLEPLA
jgi:hypothetical protein